MTHSHRHERPAETPSGREVAPAITPNRSFEHLGQPLSKQRERLLAEDERAKEAVARLTDQERFCYTAD